jgi:hypothetical protein
VRDDLHGCTEVIAAALLGDDPLVNAAGRVIAVATGGGVHKALVVPQIQISLGAIGGDEYLAMLERAHRARIDVDVGIELDHRDLQAPGLENGTERCGGDSLSQ